VNKSHWLLRILAGLAAARDKETVDSDTTGEKVKPEAAKPQTGEAAKVAS
jgi:hypothetical protein